ncbi:unnamed protein product, partial [Ascophyllum nodosum]
TANTSKRRLNSRSWRSSLSVRILLPLLCSASLLALALVLALSVALPRPVSSLLLSSRRSLRGILVMKNERHRVSSPQATSRRG